MIDFLNQIDSNLMLLMNGYRSPFLDRFMMMFTGRFIWVPMYAAIMFIFIRTLKPKMVVIYTIAIAMAITLTDQTCASLIRPFVERLRPSNLENPLSQFIHIVNGYRGGPYGFPSCHSANSFALATFMSLFIPRKKFTLFIFGWAILNSYSRIYIGVHYPGDLLVGAFIGSFYGALTYFIARCFDTIKRKDIAMRSSKPVSTSPIAFQAIEAIRIPVHLISVNGVMVCIGLTTALIIIAAAL